MGHLQHYEMLLNIGLSQIFANVEELTLIHSRRLIRFVFQAGKTFLQHQCCGCQCKSLDVRGHSGG